MFIFIYSHIDIYISIAFARDIYHTVIAIHGTNDESTIGTKSSRGCIRLYNGELKEVYNMFEAGFSELRVVE